MSTRAGDVHDPIPTREQVGKAVATGTKAAVVGVVASAVLAAVKITTGLVGNAYALVADGVESLLDLFQAVLVLAGLRASLVPQSDRYPWGMGKAEPLAAVAAATLLLLAALGIAVQSVREVLAPQTAPEPYTLYVLVAVVFVKESLFRFLRQKGEAIGSGLLKTDAWHHRSDAFTSAAAFVGVSIAVLGGEGFEVADDWAALAACGIIAFNGATLLRGSLREVLDVSAPADVEYRIREVAAGVAGVAGIDQVRVRRSGLVFLVDIHIEVDPDMTVRDGHGIGHAVKDALVNSELPILDVLTHIEPRGR